MIGTVAGVARSFEITKPDGSSPWATMACSSGGSLRMNSAENPPTVDCSVIDTVGLARTLCPSWSSGRAGRFKRPDRRAAVWRSLRLQLAQRPQQHRGLFQGALLRAALAAATRQLVTRGLDPRIHRSSEESCEEDGWPGQARP